MKMLKLSMEHYIKNVGIIQIETEGVTEDGKVMSLVW